MNHLTIELHICWDRIDRTYSFQMHFIFHEPYFYSSSNFGSSWNLDPQPADLMHLSSPSCLNPQNSAMWDPANLTPCWSHDVMSPTSWIYFNFRILDLENLEDLKFTNSIYTIVWSKLRVAWVPWVGDDVPDISQSGHKQNHSLEPKAETWMFYRSKSS